MDSLLTFTLAKNRGYSECEMCFSVCYSYKQRVSANVMDGEPG